jgi:hypothetical protein
MGGGIIASGANCKAREYRVSTGDVRPFVIVDAK